MNSQPGKSLRSSLTTRCQKHRRATARRARAAPELEPTASCCCRTSAKRCWSSRRSWPSFRWGVVLKSLLRLCNIRPSDKAVILCTVSAVALERVAKGHAGAAVQQAGGGPALLPPRARWRYAESDGARLDRARTGDPRHHRTRAQPCRARPQVCPPWRSRAQVQ